MENDIQWKHRFSNFEIAFAQLSEFIVHINRIGKTFYPGTNNIK